MVTKPAKAPYPRVNTILTVRRRNFGVKRIESADMVFLLQMPAVGLHHSDRGHVDDAPGSG